MTSVKKTLLVIAILIIATIFYNYPKFNIIAGYTAKYASSSVFLANRSLSFTQATDLNFLPIKFASEQVNLKDKSVISSVFGLLNRKAIYRKGLGSVLTINSVKTLKKTPTPKRLPADNKSPYPYGNADQKDSIFTNINYKKLNQTITSVFNDSSKTRAVLVIYKDHIIAEKYDKGFTKNSVILGWSMTKSIVGSLFGIMQFQGKLNVNEKPNFAAWKNDNRKNITLNNLLQMNSGLAWNEDYESISDATKMLFLEKDMTASQLNKPLVGKPNQTWNYSSGCTNLLSGILRNKLGSYQNYLDFWYAELIDKIGMNSMVVETDLSGNYVGSSYAWATPRDWAKLGLLYLKKGNWNGQQIFDQNWVTYATTPTPTSNGWYGAQIWLNAGKRYPNVPKTMFSFNGYQGQNVFILPEQNLVVVRMALSKKIDTDTFLSQIVALIKK
ncbi:serine hydrolase domain-containing protein [Tenacibaculum sp. UWU-22]|uniref:serine hydrolase domain-containing protein n=1 Tax=Tenacibaculum sp. UWU-22 TaxID=3234187 RepID=UPI0034DB4405